eukprot:1126690-Prymnesium_polylepis.1
MQILLAGLHYHGPPVHPPPQHERVSMHWRRTVKCVSVLLGGGAWSRGATRRRHPPTPCRAGTPHTCGLTLNHLELTQVLIYW